MTDTTGKTAVREVATLGGGCFWCLEAVFDGLVGVESVESGYCGGHLANPTYEDICGGDTGHAEVVRITFDPAVVSYNDLLDVFFVIHDPTTLNAQGNDIGTQYRSVIYFHSPEQKAVAEATIKCLTDAREYSCPIVTEITTAPHFYAAEPYHQEYYENNPRQPYCQFVVAPKVAKFRQKFATRVKK
ncbi:MAG: peptide-methionine (S)-S-oxide reductase MsrA [Burkholderiales bacterium]|jgi:peptide-methionine (S)-S-oxide reductase